MFSGVRASPVRCIRFCLCLVSTAGLLAYFVVKFSTISLQCAHMSALTSFQKASVRSNLRETFDSHILPPSESHLPRRWNATPLRCIPEMLSGSPASSLAVATRAASAPSLVPPSSHITVASVARDAILFVGLLAFSAADFPTTHSSDTTESPQSSPFSKSHPSFMSAWAVCVGSTTVGSECKGGVGVQVSKEAGDRDRGGRGASSSMYSTVMLALWHRYTAFKGKTDER